MKAIKFFLKYLSDSKTLVFLNKYRKKDPSSNTALRVELTFVFIKQRVNSFRRWALEKACFLYPVRAANALKQAFSKAHQYTIFCASYKDNTLYVVV